MKITLVRPINLPAGDYATTDDLKWSLDMTADEPTVVLDVGLADLVVAPSGPVPVPPPASTVAPPDTTPPTVAPPPDLPPPPHPDVISDTVTLTGALDDGTAINVKANKGQRLQIIAGDPSKGSLMYYGDGLCACIENAWPTGDLAGTFKLTAGDTVLFDGHLTIWAKTRTRPFWLRTPQVRPDADLSAFPTYGAGSETASMYGYYLTADNSPMGRGVAAPVMGMTGEQATLGPLPQWDAVYITNPSAENAAVVRGMADSAAVWGFHLIDPATNKMLSLVDYPRASMLGAQIGAAGNPVPISTTANPNKVDSSASHAPAFCALACELFGTDYDREELALWANFCGGLWQNYSYRLPCGYAAHNHGQTRGKGRGLVVVLYAALFSSEPAYFERWLDAIPSDMESTWLGQTGIHVDQKDIPYPNGAIAPWQNHILGYGIGLALEHGHSAFQRVFDYFAETWMDSMLDSPHELATIYEVAIKDGAGSFVQNWSGALALAAIYDVKLAAALQCAEGSQALMDALQRTDASKAGDFIGYPTSPTGYAAMMQPFGAMVAKHATDQVRAQAAWAKFLQWRRIDSRDNPKYDVVP